MNFSVDGIVEDVTDIVLTKKRFSLSATKLNLLFSRLEVEKEGEVTAVDISPAEGAEIINPEQLILTTDRKQKIVAEMTVSLGEAFA